MFVGFLLFLHATLFRAVRCPFSFAFTFSNLSGGGWIDAKSCFHQGISAFAAPTAASFAGLGQHNNGDAQEGSGCNSRSIWVKRARVLLEQVTRGRTLFVSRVRACMHTLTYVHVH